MAEHLGIDRDLGPPLLVFTRREAIRAQQLQEELTDRHVREAGGGVASFERRLAEQATVEERNAAEASRRGRTLAHRRIERAEEQRQHDVLVKAAAPAHAFVEAVGE